MPTVDIINSEFSAMSARVHYSVSQDAAGNCSTVTVTKLELNSNNARGICFVTGTVSINGQEVCKLILTDTVGYRIDLWNKSWNPICDLNGTPIGGTPVRIPHGSDGTKTVSVSVSLKARHTGTPAFTVPCSGSADAVLPRIPRVTGISASGVTLGTPMTITLSRAASSFRDTVFWKCGSASGVVADKTGGTALSWTPPVSLASQNTQGTTVDVVLTVTTYSGDTAVGSKSVTVRCTIPGSVVPTLTVSVSDNTDCYNRYGSYIRTRSQARVKTTASGAYGSTIKSVSVVCGGLTGTGTDKAFALPNAGTAAIRVTVTDSRGRTASASQSITVTDYQNPSASITALYRCGSDGTPNPQGAYGKAVFTGAVTSLGGKNTAGYKLKKRVRGTSAWSVSELSGYAGQYSPRGEVIFSAGADNDFEVCVSAADYFTGIDGPVAVLPVSFSLLDFHRGNKSVGILQRASTPGAVDLGGDTVHHGHRIRDVGAPQAPDDAVTLRSLLNAVYPVGTVYSSAPGTDPAALFGGTWERLEGQSPAVYMWKRTA